MQDGSGAGCCAGMMSVLEFGYGIDIVPYGMA